LTQRSLSTASQPPPPHTASSASASAAHVKLSCTASASGDDGGAPGGGEWAYRLRGNFSDAPDVRHMRSDAYFYDHYGQAPNAQFYQDTLNNNSTVQDCAQPLPDKYFFFQKDHLALTPHYPHLVQRRQLQPEPQTVQCFSSKMLLLTRTDVPVEWVHLFVQSVMKSRGRCKETLSTSSTLQDFVALHQTLI
jgi:hypothetical protein